MLQLPALPGGLRHEEVLQQALPWDTLQSMRQTGASRTSAESRGPDSCNTDVGDCTFLPCFRDRGPVQCLPDGPIAKRCHCLPGFCASDSFHCTSSATEIIGSVFPISKASPSFPASHQGVEVGLCSSGGGGRALSFFVGGLRALTNLGLMPRFDALSTASGSTWASAIYMFANRTSEQLLGKPTLPQELTLDLLQQTSSEIGAAQTTSTNLIIAEMILTRAPLNKIWSCTIGQAFLSPFGLDSTGAYLAASAADVARILENNPQLTQGTFHVPQLGRPRTFVMLGTALSPRGYKDSADSAVGLQMSPDYIGIPFYPNDTTVNYTGLDGALTLNRVVGGGFVEAFAFNGQAPQDPKAQNGGTAVRLPAPPIPFSLTDAVGISSWAVGARAAGSLLGIVDPVELYWPVTSARFPGPQAAIRYNMGDGGDIDNAALLPLLQRGASRVVWFANSVTPLNRSYPWAHFCACTSVACGHDFDPILAGIVDQVLDKFGYGAKLTTSGWFYLHNQVFSTGEVFPLACKIWRLVQAGEPAIVQFNSRVMDNTWWGISGGFTVNILLVYLEHAANFNEALPQETRNEIDKGQTGMFANFPIYNTLLQNFPEATSYTMAQVNLLSAFGEYAVLHNKALFEHFLSPER